MRRIAAIIWLALSVWPVAAEPVRVQSGEHADFSRVVLIFRQPIGWLVEETGSGYDVVFDRDGLEPDLSSVFEKIPRDRITDVRFDGATRRLSIDTACPCPIEVFEAGRGVVAVDIRTAESRESDDNGAPSAPPVGNALILPVPVPRLAPPLRIADRLASPETAEPTQPASAPPVFDEILEATRLRERLAQEISRAASSGLLGESATPSSVAGVVPPPPAADETPMASDGQIRISGPFDPDASAAEQARLARCGQAEPHLAALRTGADPVTALSEARTSLVDDAGRLDPVGARTLANTYIGLGLGTEAASILRSEELRDSVPDVLLAAAALVDGHESGEDKALAALAECGGQAGLWSIALLGDARKQQAGSARDLVAAFGAMSSQLQLLLGPTIVDALASSGVEGLPEAAHVLQRQLDLTRQSLGLAPTSPPGAARAPHLPSPDSIPLGAEFADAESLLDDLRTALARDSTVSTERLELALGMAEELRERALGRDLMTSVAELQIVARQPEAAFRTLDRVDSLDPGPGAEQRLAQLLDRLLSMDDDALFLGAVFGRALLETPDRIPDGRLRPLADRLADLGFFEQAEALRDYARAQEDPGGVEASVPPPEPTTPTSAEPGPQAPDEVVATTVPAVVVPAASAEPRASAPPGDPAPLDARDTPDPTVERLFELRRQVQALASGAGPGLTGEEPATETGPPQPEEEPALGLLNQSEGLIGLSRESRTAIAELLNRPLDQ